ncbi:hypothetical protein QBA35_38755 [Streptomyces bottropensis]|uniref:Uncharacterized protein n=1 Tax=Streptomyces bottropensis TaxID=42235 RepID=A0ABU8AZI6_9ACTN
MHPVAARPKKKQARGPSDRVTPVDGATSARTRLRGAVGASRGQVRPLHSLDTDDTEDSDDYT